MGSKQKTIHIYNTKYALSTGITEHNARSCDDISEGMVDLGGCRYLHGEGREWHRTREGAVTRAKQMRMDKIASLRKQIAKLERLIFT